MSAHKIHFLREIRNNIYLDTKAIISPAIVIDNQLVITEDLVIILPVWTCPFHNGIC